jgi:hypothetical protein
MTNIQIHAQISTEELVRAVEQLPPSELDEILQTIMTLRLLHTASVLSQSESELLLKINQPLPKFLQERYDLLIAKRKNETLTTEEHTELLQLTDQVEHMEEERVQHLATLAQVQHISLSQLLQDLGIEPKVYA